MKEFFVRNLVFVRERRLLDCGLWRSRLGSNCREDDGAWNRNQATWEADWWRQQVGGCVRLRVPRATKASTTEAGKCRRGRDHHGDATLTSSRAQRIHGGAEFTARRRLEPNWKVIELVATSSMEIKGDLCEWGVGNHRNWQGDYEGDHGNLDEERNNDLEGDHCDAIRRRHWRRSGECQGPAG